MQGIDFHEPIEPGGGSLTLAQEVARSGIDKDWPAAWRLYEKLSRGQVGDQRVKHAGGLPQVVRQMPLLRDIRDDPLPANQPAEAVELRNQGIAQPASGRLRTLQRN